MEISVKDSGIGMEPEFVPRAFDRFHQADSSTTRSHGGLGLGLAIVRHLVEMHGGEVEAQSAGDEQGSTFIVRLPVLSVAATPAKLPEEIANSTSPADIITARLNGKKILVVEDEPDSRQMIEAILQMHDAQVQSVADVPAALQIFPLWKPDVLVSDIGLPGEDGYSLLRQLRALPDEQGGAIPALALTAFARESDRIAAQEAGFQDHLTKPISPTQLAVAVALLVEE